MMTFSEWSQKKAEKIVAEQNVLRDAIRKWVTTRSKGKDLKWRSRVMAIAESMRREDEVRP